MKKKHKGIGELLELLKARPELVNALVFDPASVKRLLKGKTARRLILGVDTRAFLRRALGSGAGGPIALCLQRTASLCLKGTRCPKATRCPGGTKPPRPCASGTKPV